MMHKSLDVKLAEIHANPNSNAFILADAKDADMALGMASAGRHADGRLRSLAEYREHMRENVAQGLLDIMLMSVSSSDVLAVEERLFANSAVTPAIRANDTTDIHCARGSSYGLQPSRPFRTAVLDHALYGKIDGDGPMVGSDLGLYSMTFNNDLDLDLAALAAYRAFRIEAEAKGFRHFLEVFNPNTDCGIAPDKVGAFLNDQIARLLAGVARAGRPLFLKIPYPGPKYMEELATYDPHLVPGILGGSSGTTYDAFKLLAEAKAHGAKAALFGRKINNSEHQPTMIQHLRWLADGEIEPEEAVKSYHGALEKLGIEPHRSLDDDMQVTERILSSYGG